MSILRRCGALFTALLLFQLTLLGQGGPCGAASPGEHGMIGASSTDGMRGHTHARGPEHGCDASRDVAACASMPSCASTTTLPARVTHAATLVASPQALPEPGSVTSRIAAAPEVPPPRG